MYKLKFMFDWCSGVCLWSTNKASEDKFGGYPVSTAVLPVSQALKEELDRLIVLHDKALNWADPSGDLLWSESQARVFLTAAKNACSALRNELGTEYEITFFDQI